MDEEQSDAVIASTASEQPKPDESSRAGAVAWAVFRVVLAVPFYGTSYLVAAACSLVVWGAVAGWRDARDMTEGE